MIRTSTAYNSPCVACSDDNRFVIAWGDERLQSEGDTTNLVYAVFDQSAARFQSLQPFYKASLEACAISHPAWLAWPDAGSCWLT